jgi:hypothetical protein
VMSIPALLDYASRPQHHTAIFIKE